MAKEFGNALLKTKCNVSAKFLKFDNTLKCIEFPDDISFDCKDGDFATCAYVGMYKHPAGEKFQAVHPDNHLEMLNADYILDIVTPLGDWKIDHVRIFLREDDLISDALASAHKLVINATGIGLDLVTYIVNCLLYIESGDPDLRHLRPMPKPSNAKKIKQWRREGGEEITCDVTWVGFDYKKERQYHIDSTWVDRYLRWQMCGPGRSELRPVWVKEHTRHYK